MNLRYMETNHRTVNMRNEIINIVSVTFLSYKCMHYFRYKILKYSVIYCHIPLVKNFDTNLLLPSQTFLQPPSHDKSLH